MEYALIIDTANCCGCTACEVACKQEHGIAVGTRWIRVSPPEIKKNAGKAQLRYEISHCIHCSQPACRDACPVQAITKRKDGIVLVDEQLCTGCRLCLEACPLGVMQFDESKGLASKCNLCADRIDGKLKPACVNTCPSHCIHFGDINKIIDKAPDKNLLARYKNISS